jgi:hypothetical protein
VWKTLLAFTSFVFLSLLAADAAPPDRPPETEKQQQQKHFAEDQVIIPPFDLPEKDIMEMKDRARRLKPIIEKDRELTRMKIIDIEEVPGIVPRLRLAYGYGSVLNLPFSFAGEDVAIGAREKFNIEIKDNSLVIFPIKEFKATNLIVFERKDMATVPHHYLLVEDAASGEADLTVNIKRRGMNDLTSATDAMVRIITTQHLPEKGSAEDFLLEGRSLSLTKLDAYPFVRVMKLTKPDLYVFMIAGKASPVGSAEFWIDPGNGTSIIGSRLPDLTVRRIADGKIFKYKH